VSICGAVWRINWGDAPTWVAAFFALLAGLVAYRLYRVESRRDNLALKLQSQRDDEALRWQASVCAAWYGNEDGQGGTFVEQIMTGGLGVYLINGSSVPIYDVLVGFHYPKDPVDELPRGQLALQILPPGTHFRKPPPGVAVTPEGDAILNFKVDMTFRDSTNRRWRRKTTGELELAE
jgi:hypothetical protein